MTVSICCCGEPGGEHYALNKGGRLKAIDGFGSEQTKKGFAAEKLAGSGKWRWWAGWDRCVVAVQVQMVVERGMQDAGL
jgi:hypothetical protein